jgi:hypothetical protein
MDAVPINKVGEFATEFIETVSIKYETEMTALRNKGELGKELGDKILADARNMTSQYNA